MIDQHRLALQALSQDLTRVALGRYRGQTQMAARFTTEAKKRISELPPTPLLAKITQSLDSTAERSAEDLLMYATLTRNHAS